jgi:hypothetical protein
MTKMAMPVIRLMTKTRQLTMIAISTLHSSKKNCSESS